MSPPGIAAARSGLALVVGGTPSQLDMTALGRQEDWEERPGRAASLGRHF